MSSKLRLRTFVVAAALMGSAAVILETLETPGLQRTVIPTTRPAGISQPRSASREADPIIDGLKALGLAGQSWYRDASEGTWSAKLAKATGGIEVSAQLTSAHEATLDRVELELEIYSRDYTERAARLKAAFREAVELVAPELPEGLVDVPPPWTHETCRMERLKGTGTRKVVRFVRTSAGG